MKKIKLAKEDKLILRAFTEMRLPLFYKEVPLALQTTEYLMGLSFRCLNRDANLKFELSLLEEDEIELDKEISNNYNDSESLIFRMQMKIAYLVLQKYYNPDGTAKVLG